MNLPLITVIIPIYNVEKYLEHCVAAVRNQTYKNLEIILVDDGSSDKSREMCDVYANLDSRIIVIHKPNGGVSSARNAGLDVCKGEYISFVDSDDYVHPRFIELLYGICRKCNTDISQCRYKTVCNLNIKCGTVKRCIRTETVTGREAALRFLGKEAFNFYIVWNKLYRRTILENIRFPEDMIIAEDMCVSYQTLFAAEKVALCNVPLYYHYKRMGSAVNMNIYLSAYTIKALTGYEECCKLYIKSKKAEKIYFTYAYWAKLEAILDDHWRACKTHNMKKISEFNKKYRRMRVIADPKGYPIKLKFKLFDSHPAIYIFLRYVYEIGNGLFAVL